MNHRLLNLLDRLLRLFPRGFRERFGEEMRLDFTDHLAEAPTRNAARRFLLREALDFPANLLRAHLEEGGMLHFLRSQPVSNGLRGAALFGAAFALAGMVSTWFLQSWTEPDSLIPRLQVFYYVLFHTEHGMELIAMIPYWISSLVSGAAVGALLAFLFRGGARSSRYMLAGMLGWFVHDAAHQMFVMPDNLYFYLGTVHFTYLTYALYILSGAFLGMIFVAAESEKPHTLRWLAIGCVAYPAAAYLYLQVLFRLSIIESPWLFIAMMVLVGVYLVSIFLAAIRSDLGRRAPWMILTGAAAITVSQLLAGPVTRLLLAPVLRQINEAHGFSPGLLLNFAALDAVYGILFGLLLGLVLGFQKKFRPLQPA